MMLKNVILVVAEQSFLLLLIQIEHSVNHVDLDVSKVAF